MAGVWDVTDDGDDECPSDLMCPLSLARFRDPGASPLVLRPSPPRPPLLSEKILSKTRHCDEQRRGLTMPRPVRRVLFAVALGPAARRRCAVLLQRAHRPVMLVQSAMTYERIDLLVALNARPGIDPQTNQAFEGKPILRVSTTCTSTMSTVQESVLTVRHRDGDMSAGKHCAATTLAFVG